ncbi:MAG: DUF4389 domain-containing protein [Pseudomonadales bacterium]|nr:DUF4389 domain-containing protein [Pseudomonadales bacterium]
MANDFRDSVTSVDTWIRGLFMLLFAIIFSVAKVVMGCVIFIQFLFKLFAGDPNDRLMEFGDDLSVFMFQILQFQTFNTEMKPFPFAPWPEGDAAGLDDGEVIDQVSEAEDTGPASAADQRGDGPEEDGPDADPRM